MVLSSALSILPVEEVENFRASTPKPGHLGSHPADRVVEQEKIRVLREALAELPEQMRRCVQLRVTDDISYQEIGAILGINSNTVKVHLFQARKVLAEKLKWYFESVDF
ncbi:MAG: sigma-70 family RNA polymerase sigma factor [Acidobacteria bacterium]|nr:sigma-70 family RNA polymerase sigma factor [Acidobacteriota bacterium]